MKKTLIPLIALTLLIIGCESTAHYNRTKVVSLTGAPTEVPFDKMGKIKPYGSVKFFQSKEEVTGKYEIIAMLSVRGKSGEEAAFIKAFLYRAADLGADGVIFYRESGSAAQTNPRRTRPIEVKRLSLSEQWKGAKDFNRPARVLIQPRLKEKRSENSLGL